MEEHGAAGLSAANQAGVFLHQARIPALRHRVAEPDFRRIRGRDQVADPERPRADLQPNSFIRQTAFAQREFATDSPLGGDGFELSVPGRKRVRPFR